jgi:hypothetical protein
MMLTYKARTFFNSKRALQAAKEMPTVGESRMERLDQETLRGWLGDPEVYLLDVRMPRDGDASPAKVEPAHHFDPLQPVETWAGNCDETRKSWLTAPDPVKAPAPGWRELERLEVSRVYLLAGGWKAWEGTKYPTVPKELD